MLDRSREEKVGEGSFDFSYEGGNEGFAVVSISPLFFYKVGHIRLAIVLSNVWARAIPRREVERKVKVKI